MSKWDSVYGRMGLIFLSASAVSLLVFLADNNRSPKKNEEGKSVLERGAYGTGEQDVELEVKVGSNKDAVTVTVGEQKYSEDKLPEIFANAGERLERLILGNNVSLDEVRYNLNLPDKIPELGIDVGWELGDYKVLNLMGELQQENLKEEGTPVELKALLSYGEEEAVHTFYVNVYPPKMNKAERQLQKLEKQVEKADEDTDKGQYLVLPDTLDGKKIAWKYEGDSRAIGLFVLGIVAAGSVFALDRQKKKQMEKERNGQLTADFPQLISQFTLFLGAGMTVRKAWFKMAQEYERQKPEKGMRVAYEEMVYAMHEIQGGISEGECYERFGSRCGIPSYRKFGAMLSQNLRKGTKGLTGLLKKESVDAFEDRKNQAKRLGEEAGTKLLGPMFMMLAVVLVIIVVPAFFTIQI